MSLADEFEVGLPKEQVLPTVNVVAPKFTGSLADEFDALPVQAVSSQKSMPKAAQLQRGDSLFKGLLDPINAGAQMATHYLPQGLIDAVNKGTGYVNDLPYIGPLTKSLGMTPSNSQQIDQNIQNSEKSYQDSRAASGEGGADFARMGGNLLSGIPMSLAGPSGLASLSARLMAGAAGGAASGSLTPVTDGGADFNSEKIKQAALGAGFGAAMAPIGGALARFISPKTDASVKSLLDQGITPTPGQILGGGYASAENKLTSVPIVGDLIKNAQRRTVEDFNRAAYDRALGPLGLSAKDVAPKAGYEGVANVKSALGDAYDSLLPKLNFKADKQFGDELNNLSGMVSNGNVPPEISRQFDSILKNEVISRLSKAGTMDGQSFKELESRLSPMVKTFAGSQNPNDKILGGAIGEVLSSARSALARSNPEASKTLQDINQGYANYARIRQAAGSTGAANSEGVFTPSQLSAAVRAGDKSAGKGNFATGQAYMQDLSNAGKQVITNYPDSGTVGRALMANATNAAVGAYFNPIAAAGAGIAGTAVAAPYTAFGQKLAAALLAKRPAGSEKVADAVRAGSPILGGALSSPLARFLQN